MEEKESSFDKELAPLGQDLLKPDYPWTFKTLETIKFSLCLNYTDLSFLYLKLKSL